MNVQSQNDFKKAKRRLPFECVALVLQGGGALGAYQAGVYEALAEADIHPDWVAGVSIGAINSAIIAGNEPAERVSEAAGVLAGDHREPASRLGCRRARKLRRATCPVRSSINSVRAGRSSPVPRAFSVCGSQLHGCTRTAPSTAPASTTLSHLKRTLERLVDFRPHQCRRNALQRRRSERTDGQSRLLRQ